MPLSVENGEPHKQRRRKGRYKGNNRDLRVDGRAGRILERIADSVADDGGLVGFAALSAFISGFHIFLELSTGRRRST